MALIIKGDMPKGKCWWHDENGEEHECQFFPCYENDCPILGEIPDEHGRLVEADEITDAIIESNRNGEITGGEAGLFTAIVHNAKTIIPSTIH